MFTGKHVILGVLAMLLSGCGGHTGVKHNAEHVCSFSLLLPHPVAFVAMATCTFGMDAAFPKEEGDDDTEDDEDDEE